MHRAPHQIYGESQCLYRKIFPNEILLFPFSFSYDNDSISFSCVRSLPGATSFSFSIAGCHDRHRFFPSSPDTIHTPLANHHQEPIAITRPLPVLSSEPSFTGFLTPSSLLSRAHLPGKPFQSFCPLKTLSFLRIPSSATITHCQYAHSYSHASARAPLIQCASATNNRGAWLPLSAVRYAITHHIS